jgi:CDP-glucose 4,6-dehydratase
MVNRKCSMEAILMKLTSTQQYNFWIDRKVLVTGHTGFKGSWLIMWLKILGAKVSGVSLKNCSIPNLYDLTSTIYNVDSYICDIRDYDNFKKIVNKLKPEVIFHLAAQAIVRIGYSDPLTTFSTNVTGTVNILDSLRSLESIKVAVFVTTDKVYKNLEHIYPYRETDELGGYDPYSASKSASELIISSYRDSFLEKMGVAVSSVRAGNVIGGGDWSEDRLIPDAIRAWESKSVLQVRRPSAVRPWQHVLEPLNAYLKLAEKMWNNSKISGAYNFGPATQEAATVKEVILKLRDEYGNGDIIWGDGSEGPHEAGLLNLEINKAKTVLGVVPRWNLSETIHRTAHWYRKYQNGEKPDQLCESDINDYEKKI